MSSHIRPDLIQIPARTSVQEPTLDEEVKTARFQHPRDLPDEGGKVPDLSSTASESVSSIMFSSVGLVRRIKVWTHPGDEQPGVDDIDRPVREGQTSRHVVLQEPDVLRDLVVATSTGLTLRSASAYRSLFEVDGTHLGWIGTKSIPMNSVRGKCRATSMALPSSTHIQSRSGHRGRTAPSPACFAYQSPVPITSRRQHITLRFSVNTIEL